ncbi:uncharacterized protein [Clytia hemisphaerica]|uniref:uncharacterized protein n=1 Tax=Clytia hemisphaerica TaxID=252671 RepID=UPI0034D66310
MEQLRRKILSLKPKSIDTTKCTPRKSLYEQIIRTSQKRLSHQITQFNLGNGQVFTDPIQAAEYLLEREYGESFLFQPDNNEAIFIPPEFVSNQYCKQSPNLDDNIEENVRRSLQNLQEHSPEDWFTKALVDFLQTPMGGAFNEERIDQKAFENWIQNVKVKYLVFQELGKENVTLPETTLESNTFISDCVKQIKLTKPDSKLLKAFKGKKTKSLMKTLIEEDLPDNPTMKWFFDIELSERGEFVERKLFEELVTLKNDEVLQDVVILQSAIFMTDVGNKKHQEFDFLIFSWSKKLIIGIEVKTQLSSKRPFEQLDKYHSIFEERLGDQLGKGWTFCPAIYVAKDKFLLQNRHYISKDTNIKLWLKIIIDSFPEVLSQTPSIHPIEQLKKILKIIVFTIYVSKKDQQKPITSSCWINYVSEVIDSLSSSQNIIFYSQKQHPVLTSSDPRYNKLVIYGGFGTGKSFLLQEKAIMMSKDDRYRGSVLYLVAWEGLLYHERKTTLEPYGIKVGYAFGSQREFDEKQMTMQKAVFLDEWEESSTFKLSVFQNADVCWIALSAFGRERRHFDGNKFQSIQLSLNLRNSKSIVKTSQIKAEKELCDYSDSLEEPPTNFPTGPPTDYVDSIIEAVTKARNETDGGILIITDWELEFSDINEQYKFYMRNGEDDFLGGSDNPYEWLKDGNILITSPSNVEGFEWPTIIWREESSGYLYSLEKFGSGTIMRCTTRLYIVGQDEENTCNQELPFNQISKLLRISITDNELMALFKSCAKRMISEHLRFTEKQEWLRKFLPIIKTTLMKFSELGDAPSKEIIFSSLSEFLLLMITELVRIQNTFDADEEDLDLLSSTFHSIIQEDFCSLSTYYSNENYVAVIKFDKMEREKQMKLYLLNQKYLNYGWLRAVFARSLEEYRKEKQNNVPMSDDLIRFFEINLRTPKIDIRRLQGSKFSVWAFRKNFKSSSAL